MIRGLTWGNVRWLALFSLLLCMIASADGAYRLNYAIAHNIFSKVWAGWGGVNKASQEAAKQIDIETQRRYGYDPLEPRAANCATTPNPASHRLTLQHLTKLNIVQPLDENQLIAVVGEAYCQQSSGSKIWLIESTKILKVINNPFTYQLEKLNP